jgi:hypothetical protein
LNGQTTDITRIQGMTRNTVVLHSRSKSTSGRTSMGRRTEREDEPRAPALSAGVAPDLPNVANANAGRNYIAKAFMKKVRFWVLARKFVWIGEQCGRIWIFKLARITTARGAVSRNNLSLSVS